MFGSVVQLSETDLRLYYLVDGQSAGIANCVAMSNDGATWTKPSLGLVEWGARANRTNSKANNSECCLAAAGGLPFCFAAAGRLSLDRLRADRGCFAQSSSQT